MVIREEPHSHGDSRLGYGDSTMVEGHPQAPVCPCACQPPLGTTGSRSAAPLQRSGVLSF